MKLCYSPEVVIYKWLWGLLCTCGDLIQHTETFPLWGKKKPSCVTMCSPLVLLLLVLLSAGELAGLHRGAGASWTSGPSASAQTPHETAADTAGQGAADRPIQLHMRAPENSSGLSPPHSAKQCSGGSSLVSGCKYNDVNASARLGLFSTFSLTWYLLLFLLFIRLCVVESDATASQCHIWMFIWTFMESRHHKSGLNTKSNLVNAGENP